jgi:hypothetical protein
MPKAQEKVKTKSQERLEKLQKSTENAEKPVKTIFKKENKIFMIDHDFDGDPSDLMDHFVTEEDMKLNPELAELGAKIGDKIGIPYPKASESESEAESDSLAKEAEKKSRIETRQAEKDAIAKIRFRADEPSYAFHLNKLIVAMVDKKPVHVAQILIVTTGIKDFALKNDVVMRVNLGGLAAKIKAEKDSRLQFESQEQQMMDNVKIAELDEYDKRIADLERDQGSLEEECPDIRFPARILRVDDSGTYPKIEMQIPTGTVATLNEAFDLLENYVIQLQPQGPTKVEIN